MLKHPVLRIYSCSKWRNSDYGLRFEFRSTSGSYRVLKRTRARFLNVGLVITFCVFYRYSPILPECPVATDQKMSKYASDLIIYYVYSPNE